MSIIQQMSMASCVFIPGIIASMSQPLRPDFIQVKSLLTVLSICWRISSRQSILGSVSSWIMRLTPAGILPASQVCAADSMASLISSRIAALSSSLSRGRPLPLPSSSLPSPSPSPSSSPAVWSSSNELIRD